MDNTIMKFFELRDRFLKNENPKFVVFVKHLLVYFYEYQNQLYGSENSIIIPGKYDLVQADKVLFELGYRGYSICYIPKGIVYKCDSTKIVFRNTLW